jgi:Spy/CpxP family protein refolding chaperone
MRSRTWLWMAALAGVIALAVPAARTMAQAPAPQAEEDALEDEIEDSLDDYVGEGGDPGPPGGMGRGGGGHGGPGGPGMMHGRGGRGGHGGHGAGRGGMRHGMGMGGGFERHLRVLHQLDLSPSQKDDVREIVHREMKRSVQARADIQKARIDLRALMHDGTPDREAIEAQIEEIGSMRTAMHKAHVAVMFEVRGLLTSEQKRRLQELHEDGPGMQGRGLPGSGGRERERPHRPDDDVH